MCARSRAPARWRNLSQSNRQQGVSHLRLRAALTHPLRHGEFHHAIVLSRLAKQSPSSRTLTGRLIIPAPSQTPANSLAMSSAASLAKLAPKSLRLLSKTPVRRAVPQSARTASQCAAPGPSNPSHDRPNFPCVDAHAARESRIISSRAVSSTPSVSSGPEPPYARPNPTTYKVYHHTSPLPLVYADPLPAFDIAYETWGTLSPRKDNVILLHTGLSASSHAASTELNPSDGWWEKFIGPGKALDTNQFFIICTNVLGGCYGSTGPQSPEPVSGEPYATRFPVLSIFDMVRAQFCLLDHLGIERLYASVGSSMGAMQSLAAGWLFPERVGKVVSISGTARSSPSAIAMRFAQRSGESARRSFRIYRS